MPLLKILKGLYKGWYGKLNVNKKTVVTIILTSLLSNIPLVIEWFHHKSEIERYKEQLIPEINCGYNYIYNVPLKEDHKFVITNIGIPDCVNI